jgi:hypothetical protein
MPVPKNGKRTDDCVDVAIGRTCENDIDRPRPLPRDCASQFASKLAHAHDGQFLANPVPTDDLAAVAYRLDAVAHHTIIVGVSAKMERQLRRSRDRFKSWQEQSIGFKIVERETLMRQSLPKGTQVGVMPNFVRNEMMPLPAFPITAVASAVDRGEWNNGGRAPRHQRPI